MECIQIMISDTSSLWVPALAWAALFSFLHSVFVGLLLAWCRSWYSSYYPCWSWYSLPVRPTGGAALSSTLRSALVGIVWKRHWTVMALLGPGNALVMAPLLMGFATCLPSVMSSTVFINIPLWIWRDEILCGVCRVPTFTYGIYCMMFQHQFRSSMEKWGWIEGAHVRDVVPRPPK